MPAFSPWKRTEKRTQRDVVNSGGGEWPFHAKGLPLSLAETGEIHRVTDWQASLRKHHLNVVYFCGASGRSWRKLFFAFLASWRETVFPNPLTISLSPYVKDRRYLR